MTSDIARKRKRPRSIGRRKDLAFYCLILALPVLQFCVFYIGVNFNSILLTFQEISTYDGTVKWTFSNLTDAVKLLVTDTAGLGMAKMSLLSYALILLIGTPLGLFFSYYISKKMPLSGIFRVLLFMPSIISSIVMVTIFKFFVENSLPTLLNNIFGTHLIGFLGDIKTRYATLIFYNIWIGFGTSVLLYSNSMSGISQEIIESAHLDGASGIREFWHITLPMVFPTLSTFLVTGIAGIFGNQINLFSFYGKEAPAEVQTYGYYLYKSIQQAGSNRSKYPPLAALGVIMTVIVVPVTMLVKHLLERFGPSED